MSHNTFGHLFRVTTWGESHGPAIGCVVDGCPPGVPLEIADIQRFLEKRRPGQSRFTTQRLEPDAVEILSGVFTNEAGQQVTTGTPISLVITNVDQRAKDYSDIKDKFRPGHADYTYWKKYKIRDFRGGGRSSARETAMRVAAGAVAKKYLQERYGISIRGYLAQLGPIKAEQFDWDEVEVGLFHRDRDVLLHLKREGLGQLQLAHSRDINLPHDHPLVGKAEHDAQRSRWYLATKVPIRDAGGRVTGLVGISKDITERRKAEESERMFNIVLAVIGRIGTAGGTTANASQFRVPNALLDGNGVASIIPAAVLPDISDTGGGTTIDGATQTINIGNTNAAGPEVELNGNGTGVIGINITSGDNTIRGLVINRYGDSGIVITGDGATNNFIEGNYIGTDVTGTVIVAMGNDRGIEITNGASNNTIGGTGAGTPNVISGNINEGIIISNATTTGNTVLGNFIGTDSGRVLRRSA